MRTAGKPATDVKTPMREMVPMNERTVSVAGIIAMFAGMGAVVIELRTGFMFSRLDTAGRLVILICGGFFSVWGLKEIVAGLMPALNQSRLNKHQFALPIEGQMYVLIMFVMFVGALIGRSNPLVLIFSLMAGPFIVNGWITFMMLKKLAVVRSHPERVMAGEPALIEVCLQNRKRLLSTWLVTVVDRVANPREVLHPKVQFSVVPPHSEETGHYRIELNQRGMYHLGAVVLNTRFPLGLVERGITLDAPSRILVYPRIGRMHRQWLSRLLPTATIANSSIPRGGPHDDDFRKLREYRPGDDPRAIHWATSARQSELMVREYQEHRDADCIVLLDAWIPAKPDVRDRERSELTISLATSIWLDRLRQSGDSAPVFVANAEHPIDFGGGQTSHQTDPLLDELAQLNATEEAEITTLLQSALRHATAQHSLILVTPRREYVEQMLPNWLSTLPPEQSRIVSNLLIVEANLESIDSLMSWN